MESQGSRDNLERLKQLQYEVKKRSAASSELMSYLLKSASDFQLIVAKRVRVLRGLAD